ncbi:carbohydrate ABC transporter permease [Vallitalea pronyensis]|nr:carbohydrate ABC transporter permease [Vallitalea pronyensis]
MRKIKQSREDKIFDMIKITILVIALILVLYPLYFIVIASVSSSQAVNTGQVWYRPIGFNLEGYRRIFDHAMIWMGYRNTILYTFLGTSINVLLTLTLAYPLSRKTFRGGRFIMIFLLITMYFNGGLIPRYLVVQKLGLYDDWKIMVLINAVNVFNVIIARTFLKSSIPDSLFEAATIDGCSHINFLWKIVMPLSKAIIAVLILYYGIAHWNEYFTALIYLNDEKLYSLQLVLRSLLIESQAQDMLESADGAQQQDIGELLKYGLIIVSSLPVLILYPLLQKYFVQGVMIGSVKG